MNAENEEGHGTYLVEFEHATYFDSYKWVNKKMVHEGVDIGSSKRLNKSKDPPILNLKHYCPGLFL